MARQLGVSAAALYRYVSNKNDLILACHEEAMEIADRALTEGTASGRNGLEKVQLSLRNYLVVMMAELGVPALILEENVLEGPEAERIYALRDDYERRLRGLIEEGRRDGSILDLEPKVAVFTLLGAVHWTANGIAKPASGMPGTCPTPSSKSPRAALLPNPKGTFPRP